MHHTHRIILTGATGGLGQAFASMLAHESSHLLLLGRNMSTLQQQQAQLQAENPNCTINILAGDLQHSAFLQRLEDMAKAMHPTVLIHNAGINCFDGFLSTSIEQHSLILNTNLLMPMQLNHLLLPTLLKEKSAQVIHIGSILGYIGYPGNTSYCASKFGLRGYAQALSRELSDGPVRVRYFAPRATQTTLNSDAVNLMNQELGTHCDHPEWVAERLRLFLDSTEFEMKLGWPEKLFVFLNHLRPSITDNAIAKQLPVIKKFFSQGKNT